MSSSPKKPFVVRLDPATLEAYSQWANDEFRSVNGQMEYILTQALRQKKTPLSNPSIERPHGSKENPVGLPVAGLPDGVGPV
jgi:hypothetical protein